MMARYTVLEVIEHSAINPAHFECNTIFMYRNTHVVFVTRTVHNSGFISIALPHLVIRRNIYLIDVGSSFDCYFIDFSHKLLLFFKFLDTYEKHCACCNDHQKEYHCKLILAIGNRSHCVKS